MTNTEIKTKNQPKKKAANIQVDKLRTFEGHPFKVLDDEDMGNLIESIRQQGIISPLIVRAIESTDEYEVISGHRRLHAAVKGQENGFNFVASCDKVRYRRRNRKITE